MPPPVPAGASLLWRRPFPVWIYGDWKDHEVRTAAVGPRRLAVVGSCDAGDAELGDYLRQPAATRPTWPGAYMVVVCAEEEVRVLTDPTMVWPVYTTATERGVVWGSSCRALADLRPRGFDMQWLATALAAPATVGDTAGCPFRGVTAARPGHSVTIRPGQPPQSSALWQPPARVSAPQAADRLRLALGAAVGARLARAGHVTADCSGGLDSTSLCLLAAARSTPMRPVTAVTVHPAGVHSGGDLDYARLAVDAAGVGESLRHVRLPLAARHAPYAALDELPATDEPAPSTITFARLRAELRCVSELSGDAHLTGDGGDSLLGPPSAYLAELARAGRFLRLARDVQGWARLYRSSPWPKLAEALTPRRRQREPSPWITDEARDLAARGDTPQPSPNPADQAVLAELRTVGRTARADGQLAEAFGVDLHNPFLDGAVVDAVLSARPADRGSPWSYKPLLSAAMADALPVDVARRATKGAFDADHHRGLRAHFDAAADLADGRLAALGLIAGAALRRTLRHAAAGLPVAFGSVEPPLAVEAWMRALDSAKPTVWTTTAPDQTLERT